MLQGSNPFSQLTELSLFINNIAKLPTNLSFAQLKVLNLNRNQELSTLHLGFCPLLEQLAVASCNLNEIGHLKGCPQLTELDVSFNHLPSLKALVDCLPHRNLTSLKFNDNLFSVIADQTATYNQNAVSNL